MSCDEAGKKRFRIRIGPDGADLGVEPLRDLDPEGVKP
jgi:hypothetical protein